MSLHPRFEINKQAGTFRETDEPTLSQFVRGGSSSDSDEERMEPDLAVYSDALLLIDALERYDVSELEDMETALLVNLYTLLSDVQRDADDLRGDVANILLDRVHHDQPVHRQFGSVQRTDRTYRSLRDEEEVLETLEDAGIPRERVTSVDSTKVDEALEVTEVGRTSTRSKSASTSVRPRSTKRRRRCDSKVSKTDWLRRRTTRPRNFARRSRSWKDGSTTSRASDPVRGCNLAKKELYLSHANLPDMKRQPVSSSLLETVGYDPETETLEAELENGRVYQYRDVPESTYNKLLEADSIGRYFNQYIRDLSHTRIE